MNIQHKDWSLTLDLDGGRIHDLSRKETRVLGTYNRIDGKTGTTHLCVPSFDKEGQEVYLLPFHGYARTLMWSVVSQTENAVTIHAVTPRSASYPASLEIIQTFTLNDIFHHEIRIVHREGEVVPVNVGIHYYWDTPQGWKNTQINGADVSGEIQTNGYMNLTKTNIVRFPHATYELTSNGFQNAVLWTSFKDSKNEGKQFSQDFCCVEPVVGWPQYFGTQESNLKPGQTVSFSVGIRKVV